MFLETKQVETEYTRTSKLNKSHTYKRLKTILVLRCDRCEAQFERDLGRMDHRRISEDCYHVCPKCNPKQFAQNKGVERRRVWNMSVDTDLDISKF